MFRRPCIQGQDALGNLRHLGVNVPHIVPLAPFLWRTTVNDRSRDDQVRLSAARVLELLRVQLSWSKARRMMG
jgi:hypothetical protein